MDLGNDDETDHIALTKEEVDRVIDWVSKFLNGKDEEGLPTKDEAIKDGFTLEERNQMMLFYLRVSQ
jgi:hypothetical protein